MSRFVNPVPQFYLNNGDIASAGKLYFYETGTTTKKDTYSNFGMSVKNTNPVILSGEGRCPNIFGEGRYTVVFKDSNDIEQWSRDDVELSVELGQYADWSPILTYRINDIVRGSDGEYYRSIIGANVGNDPTTTATAWEQIAFFSFWNTNVSYSQDDIVLFSGAVYRSEINNNSGNQPDQSSTDTWANLSEPSQWISTVTYQTGDLVVYASSIYESLTNGNVGNQPDISGSDWRSINVPSTRTITAGRGLSGGGDLSADRTINTYRKVTSRTSVGTDAINSEFDRVYIFSGPGADYNLSIEQQATDEGATETVLICREGSIGSLQINAGTGVSMVWSFDESISVSGYKIKPGEIVRLIKIATNSYVAYADNGISETVTLGGDFDAGMQVVCRRIGNEVSVDAPGDLTHPSLSNPQSAVGVIPTLFRPDTERRNIYQFSLGAALTIRLAGINADGTYILLYASGSGSAVNSSGSVVAPSMYYQIT